MTEDHGVIVAALTPRVRPRPQVTRCSPSRRMGRTTSCDCGRRFSRSESERPFLVLGLAGVVVLSALLRVREYLVSALEKEECLGISGSRVIRMNSSRHHPINPMNGLAVRVGANLQDFVVIAIRFHGIHLCVTSMHARAEPPTAQT